MYLSLKKAFILLPLAGIGILSSCSNTGEQNTEQQTMKAKRIELRDFFRNPEKSAWQISPNGKYFSYMAPYQNRMNVFVQEVGNTESTRITDVTDRDIAGYTWANNNRILFVKDNGGDENYVIYAVNIDGSNYKALTPTEGVLASILDDLENDDEHIMISMNKRNPEIFDPYKLNIVSGEMEMLAENPGNISSWITDHDGKVRIAITTDGINSSMLYRKDEKSPFKSILTTNYKESVSPLFFTFDNKNLYASSNLGRDKSAIVLFDLENATEKEVIFEHPEVDVENMHYSNKRKVLTSISYTTHKRERHFLDDETRGMIRSIENKLPGYEIGISASNKNEDVFIVRTYSDKSLGAYYVYDKNADSISKIEDVAPWIDENEMAEMKPITYESRDGLKIHAYLTLPKGVDAKNLALVVNPHGGPWARDAWGYNPEVQFLANRGYAVLQMNFRGSVGYGRKFWEASFKEWGLKMQDDITDGVKYLVDQGIADENRIAIYGASYGGYATLAGLCFTPDVYACGIDYVGVSNLFTFMSTIPPYWKPYLEMMYEMVGNPEADKDLFTATSPVFHADKIKVPLLIAQGAKDPRVNVAESDQMVEALKARGIEVEYLVEPEEGHGFRNEENRFKFYEAVEKFLDVHLAKK